MGQPFQPAGPSPYAPHEAPTPRPRRPWGAAIVGLVLGLVVAVAVGGVLLATKTIRFSSGEAAGQPVGTAPITLPATLGGLTDLVDATRARAASSKTTQSAKIASAQEANQQKVSALTIASYQRADPGAAVAFRAYADADLLHLASVIAVRAQHPGLTLGPVPDPAYLGVAVNQQQIKVFGDVQCAVFQSQPTAAGKPVDPKLDVTTVCQRTGPELTVLVYGGAFDGPDGQQTMNSLTNAAWSAVSS